MTLPTRNVETFSSPVNTSNGKIDANTVRGNDNVLGQRINATTLDVRRFGAIGDGVKDDTDALLRAFDSGEEVIIPRGYTFLVSTTLTTTQEGFRMSGGGTLKLAPASNCTLLYLNGATYSVIDGVKLDGDKTNQTIAAVLFHVRNGAYSRLSRLFVTNSKGGGIKLENYEASELADEINLRDSLVFFSEEYGVQLTYSGTAKQAIGDCVIGPGNHINFNAGHGVHARGGTFNVFMGDNVLTNGLNGYLLEGIPADSMYVYGADVVGVMARNNGGSGLYAHASGTANGGAGLTISESYFHYNNSLLAGAANLDVWDTDNPTISNNYCGDLNFATRTPYGLQMSRVNNAQITGNRFVGNLTAPTAFVNGSTYQASSNVGLADASAAFVSAYSASITPDAPSGSRTTITATNGTAFTINAPGNPGRTQRLLFTISNTSGGALGVITWDAVYKMAAWTSPATGFSRSIEFEYNGTNWVEISRTSADVPN